MNSTLDNTTYIERVMLPFYKGYSTQNIEMCIRGIDGRYIFATDKFSQSVIGAPIKEILRRDGEMFSNEIRGERLTKARTLLVSTMSQNPSLMHAIFIGLRHDGEVSYTSYLPLFNPQGELFAIQITHEKMTRTQTSQEIFARHHTRFNTVEMSLDNILPVPLTEVEQCVLTLLLLNYSQESIAKIFGVSRSYVAKIISDNLCPKFNVSGFSAKQLVEQAVDLKYHFLLPKGLLLRGKI
jgi:hypothetical protein